MAVDREMTDFVEHLEGMIAERLAQLMPLVSGEMRMGRRGPDTDGQWVDITEPHVQSLKNEITSLKRTVERARRDHA
jgi:hypothetical protein